MDPYSLDAYARLHLKRGATTEKEAKLAYRKAIREAHPDLHPEMGAKEANALTQAIQQDYNAVMHDIKQASKPGASFFANRGFAREGERAEQRRTARTAPSQSRSVQQQHRFEEAMARYAQLRKQVQQIHTSRLIHIKAQYDQRLPRNSKAPRKLRRWFVDAIADADQTLARSLKDIDTMEAEAARVLVN